ncbi:xylitol dehydrogenase [Auricularia subglabra TFB-10046 SS5]|uniref:Xylitol dehydrogenase n=1 Tax=Auricularia subglabra (strain TFB-10046 / SS5) TaxID=717982 RepID=J0D816_AURST|nr:xylitol dehydrogenase [Auricularia subglabra TFB-10046 SS5]
MSDLKDNKSFVLRAIEDVAFEERPVEEPGPDEALIAVRKTGICGSDVHFLVHGRIGDFIVESPMVLGHESSGVVYKGRRSVGSKVKTLKPGDRVALEPGASCRVCDACKSGRYELCPEMVFAATPPKDGTLGRYYRLPADLAYRLPDNLSLEDGAMMEPLSVGVHAVANIAAFRANQTIAVFGAGPVGLLCMAVAKALGAKRVIAIDISQPRLDFAKSYVATDTYLPGKPSEGESQIAYSKRTAAEMAAALGFPERGVGAIDLVVDASGAATCIQIGVYIVKHGGTFVQVGMGNAEVTIPVTVLLVKEVNFKGSFRYGPGDYPLAIDLVSQGRIDLKPLVTHRFAFEDAGLAFQTTKKGRSDDGKSVIKAIISGPE